MIEADSSTAFEGVDPGTTFKGADPGTARNGADHRRQLARLKRIEGQVRGVAAMIEADRYCVDILTQLQAVRAALARVERDILDSHIGHCVAAAAAGTAGEQAGKVAELTELLKRAMR